MDRSGIGQIAPVNDEPAYRVDYRIELWRTGLAHPIRIRADGAGGPDEARAFFRRLVCELEGARRLRRNVTISSTDPPIDPVRLTVNPAPLVLLRMWGPGLGSALEHALA
jgi:hypothetical protein